MVSGDEADQGATHAAFGRLHRELARRLADGKADGRRCDQRRALVASGAPRAGGRGRRPGHRHRPRPAGRDRPRQECGTPPAGRRRGGRPPSPRAVAGESRRAGPAAPAGRVLPGRRPARPGRGRPRQDPAAPELTTADPDRYADPAAMHPIAPTASAIPTACIRVTRSRRKTAARITVDHRVERRQDGGHRQRPALDGEDEGGVAGHVEDADAGHRGQEPAFRAPRGTASRRPRSAMHDHLDQADDRQRPERMAIADLGEEDAERADPDARDQREAQARRAARRRR